MGQQLIRVLAIIYRRLRARNKGAAARRLLSCDLRSRARARRLAGSFAYDQPVVEKSRRNTIDNRPARVGYRSFINTGGQTERSNNPPANVRAQDVFSNKFFFTTALGTDGQVYTRVRRNLPPAEYKRPIGKEKKIIIKKKTRRRRVQSDTRGLARARAHHVQSSLPSPDRPPPMHVVASRVPITQ